MRYLSVCSGIEAATVAWHGLGWEPAAFSEIEPFPSAVLRHHYPSVPNVGDMTRFKEWQIGSIGLLVGGTPCQSFSVAGLRKGLDDPRGNLALVYCGILDHLRPHWFVWENVPGVLSSNGGRDFGSFLGAVAQLGYGFAYRVLDAQFFGVAQRRRRVFVVGHLGDWRSAATVLFERESLRRDTAPRREAGKVAPTIPSRSSAGGGLGTDFDCDGGVIQQPYQVANCLTRRMHKGINSTVDEGQTPIIAHALRGEGFDASEDGTGRGTPLVPVAYDIHGVPATNGASATEVHVPLRARQPGASEASTTTVLMTSMQVRRLTPVECERLQGFPDGYTSIPWRGKLAAECPDGPRYKALGNSMAVPVMRWIGQRIQMVSAANDNQPIDLRMTA